MSTQQAITPLATPDVAPKKRTATIPFDGFYESWHSQAIDDEENSFWDFDGDGEPDCELDSLHYEVNYRKLFTEYAQLWADFIADKLELDLPFESLNSPREYNFTTDRLFVHITDDQASELYKRCKPDNLRNYLKANFTSRDGFRSFYSPDLTMWAVTDIAEWDHNMLGALTHVALYQACDEDSDFMFNLAQEFIEDLQGNGRLNYYDALTPEYQALHDKLYNEYHENLEKKKG